MIQSKRRSLTRAITLPLSILLLWQALGWIAFGLLDPQISQRIGQPEDSGLILTVGLVLAAATTILALFFLYYRSSTVQGDIVPKPETIHKCLNCGHEILVGTVVCPYCGSRTLF